MIDTNCEFCNSNILHLHSNKENNMNTNIHIYTVGSTTENKTNETWDVKLHSDESEATFMFGTERAARLFSAAVANLIEDDLSENETNEWELADQWSQRIRQMMRTADELATLMKRTLDEQDDDEPVEAEVVETEVEVIDTTATEVAAPLALPAPKPILALVAPL